MRFAIGVLLLAALGVQPALVAGDNSGETADLIKAWNGAGKKLVAMAEDFPEAKYDYRPTPEVRTFAEQLLHVAGSTYFFASLVKGEKPGEEDLSRETYKTKADVVAAFKKAVADGEAFMRETGEAGLERPVKLPWEEAPVTARSLWFLTIEHAGEHYGNLVVYYRLNGMVPPASRQSGN
ncbi:MAG: DinB family protein [Candidatus Acidiferrales bacterium]